MYIVKYIYVYIHIYICMEKSRYMYVYVNRHIGVPRHTSRNEGIKPSEVEDPWSWKGQQRPSASSISIRPQIVEVCVSKVEILGMCCVVKGRCRCQSRVPVTRQLRSIFTWLQLDKCCNLQTSCILKRGEVCSFLDLFSSVARC